MSEETQSKYPAAIPVLDGELNCAEVRFGRNRARDVKSEETRRCSDRHCLSGLSCGNLL